VSLSYFATKDAVAVADQFINNIQKVKPYEAYEQLSSKAKEVVSSEDLTTVIEKIGPILNGEVSKEGREISTGTDEDTISTITYKIPGSDGDTYIVVINLVKEDGKWKVLNFDSKTKANYDADKASE
jgi:hypothetical protein